MKKRVLITGSNGMLGIDLWAELEEGYELSGIDITGGKGQGQKTGKFRECDITDKKMVMDVISEIKPDIVIHTAAWTDVDGCELDREKAYRINSEGTDNIAAACKDAGAVLIFISTDFVFDGKKGRPYNETDKTSPLGIYGDSKLKGEERVERNSEKYFIVRTSWLYGKNGKNFVDTILAKAESEKELKVVDDQTGSPTYTKDLAKALHELAERVVNRRPQITGKDYGIYHVSNSGSVSWYEYAREILRLAGSKTKVVPISSEELNRPAKRPAMSVLDNSKFTGFTGYRMRGWKDALKEYLEERKTP